MAATDSATLELTSRTPDGSRSARRLRREGNVPGTIYGAGDEPRSFMVDARILRNTLNHAHAVIEISVDAGEKIPVMVKALQRHPVRGETVHVDFLRVRLDETIQTTVNLHLNGGDVAPGVKQGGILNQELIHLAVEALPNNVPDAIEFDVSGLEMNETKTVADLVAPRGVTLLDDPETVVVTITSPTVEPVDEGIETETEVVGEGTQGEGESAEASGAS